MSDRRPHRITVKLPRESYMLLRRREVAEFVSHQQVLNAAVSAYIMGELRVRPDGTYTVVPEGDAAAAWEGDDSDAVDILDLDSQQLPNGYDTLDKSRVLGIREIAEELQHRTARKVSVSLLRFLLRDLAPDYRENKNKAWKVPADDPLLDRAASAIAAGALTELRNQRMRRAGIKPRNLDIDSKETP